VEVADVGPGELLVEHRLLGEVRALSRAELSVGASGEVRTVSVREGDRVRRGQVLLEIDPSLARAQVRRAEATHSLANEEQELASWQAEQVREAGPRAVAEAEIQRSQTAAEAASARREATAAELAEARNVLSRHRIVAPFDGVVLRRSVDPGDWVDPGSPALALVSDGDVEVMVAAPAQLVLHVEPGMPAMVFPSSSLANSLSDDESRVEAQIAGVVSALDDETRTVTLRLVPAEPRRWLLAGATVRVGLAIQRRDEDAVRVPRDALVRGAVGYRVIEVVDGKARSHSVDVVATGANAALVRAEGLAVGAAVVTRGNERLRPDQEVSVQSPAAAEGASDPPAEGS
jgi:RND family efflux transporter MFP subunit